MTTSRVSYALSVATSNVTSRATDRFPSWQLMNRFIVGFPLF
jgi:hypothetical protein